MLARARVNVFFFVCVSSSSESFLNSAILHHGPQNSATLHHGPQIPPLHTSVPKFRHSTPRTPKFRHSTTRSLNAATLRHVPQIPPLHTAVPKCRRSIRLTFGLFDPGRDGAQEVLRRHVHLRGGGAVRQLLYHAQGGEVAENLVRRGVLPDPVFVLDYLERRNETIGLVLR